VSADRMDPPKLLVDEMLSPTLAVEHRSAGVDACHVRDRALNAAADARVFECGFREDRIVVTSNIRDFEHLARNCELHAVLILIEQADLTRAEQLEAVRKALRLMGDESAAGRDMVNRVLRLAGDGTHSFTTLP
jgi:predicted nuclease of predicted toxin-antitoxin system